MPDEQKEKDAQFPSQFPAVASEACLARVRRGKVSPMTTQAIGPHVPAKLAMNKQVATISIMPAASLS